MKVNIIDLHFQGLSGTIAAFLVTGPEGSILIECGPESTRERLLEGLRKHDIAPEDLVGVLVTHIHLDHAGAAGWFAAKGVPLYVHEKGARHLVDPSRLMESARMIYGDRFDRLWGAMTPAPQAQVYSLPDGMVLALAGLEIEVIATPGHAFHHHAYRIGKTLFTGDAAGARLGGNAYTSVTSAPPQFDLGLTLASIERLRKVGAERLYLTHFGAIDEVEDHLSAYAESVARAAEFIRERLSNGYDPISLQEAYKSFHREEAVRHQLPPDLWAQYEVINSTAMGADGIRLYWEKRDYTES